jgi:4-amino-4-deoxy-L-arabinose transferase-like glycosyltransferase
MRETASHDTLEGITWGLQWQLGYNKHPFLTAWLCAGVTQLFGTVGWPIYLLAQLVVSFTFYAVWKLAELILPKQHALIASLLLEGIFFYNLNSFNLTPDSMQSPLWAFLALFFYQALKTQKLGFWFATGLFAALCFCTKYQSVLLFTPMLLLCLINVQARFSFSKPGIYLALLVFFALISPHLIWLYENQFISLSYAFNVPSDYTHHTSWTNHLFFPLQFIINNLFAVSGLFVLLWPFYFAKRQPLNLSTFDWQFLFFLGLGPCFLTLVLCMLTGNHFVPRWSTPYYFALGILAMAYLRPALTQQSLKQFGISLILASSLLMLGRTLSLSLLYHPHSDAFLPNAQIAKTLSQIWNQKYQKPMPYLVGSNYLVSNVIPYLADHPKPYLSWNKINNPWINEADLETKGGLFIWDEGFNFAWDRESATHTQLSQDLLQRFPQLMILPKITFYRTSNHEALVIGVALLPPKS